MTSSRRKSIKRHIGQTYLEANGNDGVLNQKMRSSKRQATGSSLIHPSTSYPPSSSSSSSSSSSLPFSQPLSFAKEHFSHEDEKDVEPKKEEYFEGGESLDRTEVIMRSNGRSRRVRIGNPEKESLYAEFDLQSPSAQSDTASCSCMSLSTSVAVAAAAAAAFKLPVCTVSTSTWPSFSPSTYSSSTSSSSPASALKSARFRSSVVEEILLDLSPENYITLSTTSSSEPTRVPFLVLAIDEPVAIQANEELSQVDSCCVISIVTPRKISFFKFEDPVRRQYQLQNLYEIATFGLSSGIHVELWPDITEHDRTRYLDDCRHLDRAARRYRLIQENSSLLSPPHFSIAPTITELQSLTSVGATSLEGLEG